MTNTLTGELRSHVLCDMAKRKKIKLFREKEISLGFPGGSMVKNPSASAEDKGSVPDLGRSHMQWSN